MPVDTPYALLDLIGLRPILVDALGDDALLDLEGGVIFIDKGLSYDDLVAVIEQAVAVAVSSLRAR